MEKSNMAGALDRLGTIDAALKRKQTALRVLKQRIDTRHGSRPIPAEDAARIAILQREVASLERSRNAELLSLTSPSVRQQRLEKLDREVNWTSRSQSRAEDQTAPPAPPEASGASVAELRRRAESGLTSSGSLAPAPAPPHVPQTPQTQERRPPWKTGAKPTSPPLPPPPPPPPPPPNGEQHERESAANEVWLAYKEAQRLRDEELRVSMRGSWRTHSGELENLKQHAAPKVETGRERRRHSLSSADSAAGGASTYRIDGEGTPGLANGCASHAKAEPTPPSGLLRMTAAEALAEAEAEVKAAELNEKEQRRRDQRVASEEVRQMREREWALRAAELKKLKQSSTKRIDDKHSAQLLKAIEARPMALIKQAIEARQMSRSASYSNASTPRSAAGAVRAHAHGDAGSADAASRAAPVAATLAPGELWPGYASGLPYDPEAIARLHAYDLSHGRSATVTGAKAAAVVASAAAAALATKLVTAQAERDEARAALRAACAGAAAAAATAAGYSAPGNPGGPGGAAPVHTKSAPVHTKSAPVHTQSAPAHTQSASVHTQSAPVHAQSAPVHDPHFDSCASSTSRTGGWRVRDGTGGGSCRSGGPLGASCDEAILYPGSYAASNGGWVGQPPRACTALPSPGTSGSSACAQRAHAKYSTPSQSPKPLELTPAQKASVAGIIGQLKMVFAKNLSRISDTFREFDKDQSGKIDKREFRLALQKLGVVAHKSEYDLTFDSLDNDRSGTIEYEELNEHLRRRVGDPSHRSAIDVGGAVAGTSSVASLLTPATGSATPPRCYSCSASSSRGTAQAWK